jgi:hypothetical protein
MIALFYGFEQTAIAIGMTFVMKRFFRQFEAMPEYFKDLIKRKQQLVWFTALLIFSYYVRALFFFLVGDLRLIVKSAFWQLELYFVMTALVEAPNLFFLFAYHYQTF